MNNKITLTNLGQHNPDWHDIEATVLADGTVILHQVWENADGTWGSLSLRNSPNQDIVAYAVECARKMRASAHGD